jgi:hypothetical protein
MAGVITRRQFVGTTSAGALGLSADWFGQPRLDFDSTPV